ncbi:MAG: hypothetical protein IJB18_06945, partial [Clostridia bacterium]|nr:hypothetical protein [Clostridia bacterium]
QSGAIRVEDGVALIPQEIIRMDYLAQNVIGRIPSIDELTPVAQALVSLQGVYDAGKKAAKGDEV